MNQVKLSSYLRVLSIVFIISGITYSCNSERKKEVEKSQKGGKGARPTPKVDGYIVRTKTLFDDIQISGTIVANETSEIHPEVSGLLTKVYFKDGAYVSKGALLAKINDADLQAQRNKLAVQLKIAQQNENRSSQLLNIQGISRQDYDLSLLQVNNIRADLNIINTSIAKTQVRAPFSGKLGLRNVSPGSYVSPQSVLTTISQMSGLKIDFTVPEKYSNKLSLGQYINFTTDGSDRNYTARISATEPDVSKDTRSLKVRATVTGEQTGLRPGNFAKVILKFQPDNNAIAIPSQAIIPQARGKKVYVFNNGKAKFIDVETGIRDSATVQITNGLKAGDTVLVTGLLALKPDATVTLNQIVNK